MHCKVYADNLPALVNKEESQMGKENHLTLK